MGRVPEHGRPDRHRPTRSLRPDRELVGWPKYGQINESARRPAKATTTPSPTPSGPTSPTGSPTSCAPPGSSTRSTTAGCSPRTPALTAAFTYVSYKVRLSTQTGRGMYDLARQQAHRRDPRATRRASSCPARTSGSRRPTTTRAAAAPTPTGSTRPTQGSSATTRDRPEHDDPRPDDRRRHQRRHATARDLPRLGRRGAHLVSGRRVSRATARASTRSASIRRPTPRLYQGSLGTVGQAETRSPWGTLDQGGNAVEWTDTITPPPAADHDRAGLAAPARRHLQRPRLPALALGGRPSAPGQQVLQLHLPVAWLPGRRGREPEGEAALKRQRRFGLRFQQYLAGLPS